VPGDLTFFAAAIPAVILVGLSKGGLGGALALMGVPLLALVVSPVEAAAIMLPILIVMDAAGLWVWRKYHHTPTLRSILPGGIVGIGIGWLMASFVSDAVIRLIVGVVALLFVMRYAYDRYHLGDLIPRQPKPPNAVKGTFWGTVSGFTSFVSHAGGPPYQIYTMPLGLSPRVYTGTSTRYFAVVNALKVLPYFMLGQFDSRNLTASAMLLPLALAATFAGAWLVRRMRPEIFYPLMYAMIAATAIKLVADGVHGLWS